MGTLILMVTIAVEVAFATFCIVTKSNQRKVRNFVRIGAFVAFVLFCLVSVIQWGFRWYGLALLFSVWAALGAWALVGKRTEKGDYRTRSIVRRAIRTLLLVVIVMVPALIFPQYRPPEMTGKYEVATAKYSYTDTSRIETFTNTGENRKVNVECWYSIDTGEKYPLVLFSHGTGGVKASNTSTFMDLASNGYVVCSIDHPYHSMFTVGSDGRLVTADPAYLQEYMNLNSGKYDEATMFKLQQKWMNLRIADINFVLDTILAQVKDPASDAVYQRIDPEKVGLMGHSLGGESSAQVARERKDIDAVINLDADLQGEYLDYVDGKEVMNTKVYPVPILTIFSDTLTRLIAAVPDANSVIAVKHLSAINPKAFEVHLAGTDHMSLTDLPLISPFLVSMINATVPKGGGGHAANALATIEKMNAIALQFFNVYLKGEGSFTSAGTY
jgi:dienelactone hydrolase